MNFFRYCSKMQAVLYRQFFRIEAKDIMLNIVLVEPEIPMNTGNIARTCAATRSRLHLVGPLGFDISDRAVKRAGLDYWHMVDLRVYDSLEDLFHQNEITDTLAVTTKAPRPIPKAQFRDGCWLFFGKEPPACRNHSGGLPGPVLAHPYAAGCPKPQPGQFCRHFDLRSAPAAGLSQLRGEETEGAAVSPLLQIPRESGGATDKIEKKGLF